jgi:histidyl-tRNA synthetase
MTTFQTPRGTRDFLPKEMIKRGFIFDAVKKVFEAYGFEPLETPAFEEWDLLTGKGGGGEEVRKEIYYFKDKSNRELGLRFDLTVPMARVIAGNPQLTKPFKRYQIGRVWRYDRPQAGRYREFWQTDVDIVGASSMDADIECIVVMVEVLKKLGFKRFSVRINNRKVLNGLVEFVGIPNKKAGAVFRALDKLEKIGEKDVLKEMTDSKIDKKKALTLLELIKKRGKPEDVLKKEEKSLGSNDTARIGLDELRDMVEKSKTYGIGDKIEIDFSLVRGLDYYTGPIFEISIETEKNVGSAAGGGRYDNLIELYGGRWTPATGISLGFERIYEIMEAEKMFKLPATKTFVFVLSVSENVRDDVIKIAQKLRKAGVPTQTDLMRRNMKKQMEYVNSSKIPFILFVGEKELKSGKFTLRNMINGEQKSMTTETMIKAFSKLIPLS